VRRQILARSPQPFGERRLGAACYGLPTRHQPMTIRRGSQPFGPASDTDDATIAAVPQAAAATAGSAEVMPARTEGAEWDVRGAQLAARQLASPAASAAALGAPGPQAQPMHQGGRLAIAVPLARGEGGSRTPQATHRAASATGLLGTRAAAAVAAFWAANEARVLPLAEERAAACARGTHRNTCLGCGRSKQGHPRTAIHTKCRQLVCWCGLARSLHARLLPAGVHCRGECARLLNLASPGAGWPSLMPYIAPLSRLAAVTRTQPAPAAAPPA
jgi:hypothetical protein